ncbi:TonB-dependent siderophore receptor [Methylobacterium goesingense]|uniref:Iron complex outermembrane receptor protein n=1 Tax=Methylobacterium goesingense TaxID=243690 RepID=A0ABV2KZS0_9HYPH|nr:TonB-dependent siderophore receptor [Methylobacterium goesingense]GJD73046.1 Metal-pseudopaline receptor CntO [Methylobacterium goesingense]
MSCAAPTPRHPFRRRRLAGGALWLLSAGAASAQDAPSAVTLEELSVAGLGNGLATIGYQPRRSTFGAGADTAILDTPANIAVVPAQVLRDQRVISLDEALRNVSGIAQTNSVGGTQEAVVRRGFGTFRDDSILRDGRRTVLQQNFSYAIERVEVLKGPASLLYGITDPGGLINLVSKRPEFTPHGSLNLTSTSFGGGLVQGDLTGPVEGTNLAYRMVADIQSYDYWRNFGHLSRQVVAPSLTWKGDDTTVTVGYEFSHYRVPYDRGTIFDPRTGRPLRVPRDRRFDERSSQHEATSHLASLDVDHRFDDDWKLHFGYTYSHLGYDEDQIRPVSYNAVTGLLTRRADGTRNADFNAHVARLDLTGRFDTFGLRHDLLAGVTYENIDYGRPDIIRGPNRAGFNPFRPVYGTLATVPVISAPDSNLRERLSNTSLYLQDSLHLSDQWILVAGLSTQIFDQFGAKGTPAVAYTDIDGVRVLPRVGLVYKLAPNLSLYGSYSQSFKPNTSLANIVGALPPEEGEAFEVGVKADVAAGLTVTGAMFDIEKANVLVTQVVNGLTVASTAGKVRSRGFEIDVAGQILPDWAVIASYGFTQAQVTDDPALAGKQLLNTPRVTASAFLTHQFGAIAEAAEFGSTRLGAGFLEAGFGARYVGARPGDATNSFKLPEYVVCDAFLAYNTQVNGLATTLQLNLKNLFDRTYYPSSGGSNLLVAVGEPFQALVTARVAW